VAWGCRIGTLLLGIILRPVHLLKKKGTCTPIGHGTPQLSIVESHMVCMPSQYLET